MFWRPLAFHWPRRSKPCRRRRVGRSVKFSSLPTKVRTAIERYLMNTRLSILFDRYEWSYGRCEMRLTHSWPHITYASRRQWDFVPHIVSIRLIPIAGTSGWSWHRRHCANTGCIFWLVPYRLRLRIHFCSGQYRPILYWVKLMTAIMSFKVTQGHRCWWKSTTSLSVFYPSTYCFFQLALLAYITFCDMTRFAQEMYQITTSLAVLPTCYA